jgi:hypothetical protein
LNINKNISTDIIGVLYIDLINLIHDIDLLKM